MGILKKNRLYQVANDAVVGQFAEKQREYAEKAEKIKVKSNLKITDIQYRLQYLERAFGARTSKEFAENADINYHSYIKIFSGERPLSFEIARKLRKRYGVTIDWLDSGDSRFLTEDIRKKLKDVGYEFE